MKRMLVLIVAIIVAAHLGAIQYLPGSGQRIEPSQRDFHLKYHTGSDDLHFYGSNSWAVCFDFANYYHPNHINLSFTINSLVLWFPQVGDSVQVRLMTDVEGTPGLPQLASFNAFTDANLLQIQLPEPITSEKLWMLVDYPTNFSSKFVSASNGGGTHSYFLNTTMTTPYYQSFANAGFSAELLFGVMGNFEDLNLFQLTQLDLDGIIMPGAEVFPRFRIYNHSNTTLQDVRLNLTLSAQSASHNINRNISLPQPIPPHSEFVWNSSHPDYHSQGITLPEVPLQMRMRGVCYHGNQPSNSLDKYLYIFADEPPIFLVENFLRQNNAATILDLENQILTDEIYRNIHNLTYFPVLADSLANPGSSAHFNWYGFSSTPQIALGGKRRMQGLTGGFADLFKANCDSLITDRGFISYADVDITYETDNISFRFVYANDSTTLLSGSGAYNLSTNSRFFAGLFKKVQLNGNTSWVFDRWVKHAMALADPLDKDDEITIQSLTSLIGIDLDAEYRLYYWLQERAGGPIFHANFVQLSIPVANEDHYLPPPSFHVAPNPLRGNGFLDIYHHAPQGKNAMVISIYNLRGQKIWQGNLKDGNVRLAADIFPTSGVYLIRGWHPDATPQTQKISVIK